jgi:hypothetical protein
MPSPLKSAVAAEVSLPPTGNDAEGAKRLGTHRSSSRSSMARNAGRRGTIRRFSRFGQRVK